MIEIAASLLAADPLCLRDELKSIETIVDRLHLDVMDGHMVPNLALSTDIIHAIPDSWQRDIHLMVEQPETVAEWLHLRAGDTVYFHSQTVSEPQKFIEALTTVGVVPGFAINLEYALEANFQFLNQVDHFLVMGIKPGFSGQHMDDRTPLRIQWLRDRLPQSTIAVDGGVNDTNSAQLIAAGANVLVISSYLFGAENRKGAVEKLVGGSY